MSTSSSSGEWEPQGQSGAEGNSDAHGQSDANRYGSGSSYGTSPSGSTYGYGQSSSYANQYSGASGQYGNQSGQYGADYRGNYAWQGQDARYSNPNYQYGSNWNQNNPFQSQGPYGYPPMAATKQKKTVSRGFAALLVVIGMVFALLAGTSLGYFGLAGSGQSHTQSSDRWLTPSEDSNCESGIDGHEWGPSNGNPVDPYMPVPDYEPSSNGSTPVQQGKKVQTPGVVLINTTLSAGLGAGTGSVLTEDGLVLTNYHVVMGSNSVRVTVPSTNKTYEAEVVGHDERHDVAVLQLKDASGLETVNISNSRVSQGDKVVAVGNGNGQGYLTALEGTVTGTNENVEVQDENGGSSERLTGLIRTSADIVPGYSGGPLFDADGNVVGMNTAGNLGSTSETAYGWAIPIQQAIEIVDQIRAGKESDTVQIGRNPALGVTIIGSQQGASVQSVQSGSGAEAAGIRPRDIITAVDGNKLTNASDVAKYIRGKKIGDTIKVTVIRGTTGEQETLEVKLTASPIN